MMYATGGTANKMKLTNQQVINLSKGIKSGFGLSLEEFNSLSNIDKERVIKAHDFNSNIKFKDYQFSKELTPTAKDSAEYTSGYNRGAEMSKSFPVASETIFKQGLDNFNDPYARGRSDGYFMQYEKTKKFAEGGGIHIDPSKKGTFTAAATKHGESVQGFASQVLANKENYSPAMVKKANFAKNASKWKHAYGGPMGMYFDGTGEGYNGVIPSEETINKWNQMEPKTFDEGTEDGLKYLTPQPTPEFEMPYDQMVKTFGVPPPPQEDYPVTAKVPFKPGYSEQKPKQKFDAGDLAYLGNLASPLIQLFGTKKQPYDYQRVSPELVKYNPNTTADLVRRGSSLPMYLAKQQGLGQGNYLNYLAAISGKAGENIGQANLEGQMKEQIANAGIKNETNRYNAEVQRLQQEAAAKEYAGRLKSYVTGAQGLSNALSQYVLDKRAGKESEENKQLMKDYTDKHFSYLDKQLEAMKPKSYGDIKSLFVSEPSNSSPSFKPSYSINSGLYIPKIDSSKYFKK